MGRRGTILKFNIVLPIAVCKANGTDIPIPVNMCIKIDAKDPVSALKLFESAIQKLFENDGWAVDSARDW